MNLITLANAGLQLLATGLIASGAMQIIDKADYIGGVLLIVAGLLSYLLYEKFPDSPKN